MKKRTFLIPLFAVFVLVVSPVAVSHTGDVIIIISCRIHFFMRLITAA